MYLEDIARIRTGLVTSRKKTSRESKNLYQYKLLNLKCITENGDINLGNAEKYNVSEKLRLDYISQMNDILIRLSAPYTAVLIDREEYCGYVIPSHFAIVRVDLIKANPEYVYWVLSQEKTRYIMSQNSSGSTALGTINAGLISKIPIRNLPLSKQSLIGEIASLSKREQELLHQLAENKKHYASLLLNEIYGKAREK